jgi:transcriptional regulator with XRE-family HTH domain
VVVPANEAVPNPLLRQAREAGNLTQDELADGLVQLGAKGATGGLVSKWERGICRPNRFHRRLLCQFFDATREQLGLAVGATHSHPPALSGNAVGLLAHAGDAAAAARQKRSSVDPVTLEELDQDVERFALECLVVPHADLFPQVWDDWQQVEQLLDARQSLKDRAHLTLLGGQLTYFLARLSFNLADYTAARRHSVLAWQYAEDIGQAVLCASVKTLQGTIAFYAGQHHRALGHLQAAERYDNPYNRPRIAANMARVYAVLGERRDAEHALAVMERHLVDLPVQPGDSPYTSATGMSALATTLAWLGDGEIAEDYARKAVALYKPARYRGHLVRGPGQRDAEPGRLTGRPAAAGAGGSSSARHRDNGRSRGAADGDRPQAWDGAARTTRRLACGSGVKDFTERLHEYRLAQPPA